MPQSAQETALLLSKQGYRRISNSDRCISRVDRPDWREFMMMKGYGFPFIKENEGQLADQYRRDYSDDHICGVEKDVFQMIPSSGHDPIGFIPKGQVVLDIPSI